MISEDDNVTGSTATPLTGALTAATIGPTTEPPELVVNPLSQ
jgi:hypothetical protein